MGKYLFNLLKKSEIYKKQIIGNLGDLYILLDSDNTSYYGSKDITDILYEKHNVNGCKDYKVFINNINNYKDESGIIVIYDIPYEYLNEDVSLFGNNYVDMEKILSMEIDGVKLDNVVNTYRFETIGRHVIKYECNELFDFMFGNGNGSLAKEIYLLGPIIQKNDGYTSIFGDNYIFIGKNINNNKILEQLDVYKYDIDKDNQYYSIINNLLIENETNKLIIPYFINTKNENIESINIPNSVTSISDNAFNGCSNLTSINIPNSVTSIGNYAFHYCSGLTSINIPNSVTSIGDYAFEYCNSLTSINIPDSMTSIDSSMFNGCDNLEKIIIPSLSLWCNMNISRYNNPLSKSKVKLYNNENTEIITNLIIPNNINHINEYVFYDCKNIINLTIPNNIVNIGEGCFEFCENMKTLTIGSGLKKIGLYAFDGCANLESIVINSNNTVYDSRNNCNAIIETSTNTLRWGCKNTIIPNTVTKINEWAFQDCVMTTITLPSSITFIGEGAFYECYNLRTIIIEATTPPTLSSRVFYKMTDFTIYVPSNSVQTYKSASGWNSYSSKIQAIS